MVAMTDAAMYRESPTERTEAPRLLFVEPGTVSVGIWKNVLVSYWARPATLSTLEQLAGAVHAMAGSHPRGFSELHVVADGVGLPEAGVCRQYAALVVKAASPASCSVVIEGTGFGVSTLRSLITGIRMLWPRGAFRLHANIEESAPWLATEHSKRTGVPVDARQLREIAMDWRKQT